MKIVLASLLLAGIVEIQYPVFCLVGRGFDGEVDFSCDGEIERPAQCQQVDRKGIIYRCKGIPDGWIEV